MSDGFEHIDPLAPGRKPKGFWTRERCKQVASGCGATKPSEWQKKHRASYFTAWKNGWQREISKELGWGIRETVEPGHWTKETCKQAAIDCGATRPSEWGKKHEASYSAAVRNGWQREISEELGFNGNVPPGHWTKENCKQAAIDCSATKPSEWCKKHSASYGVAWRNGWQREIFEELGWKIRESVAPGHWTKETCKQAAIDCGATKPSEWKKKHRASYEGAVKNGWQREISEELGFDGNVPPGHWTKENCKQAAIDCNAIRPSEWAKKHNASYIAALRNGWQLEIYEELKWKIQESVERGHWTKENCKQAAIDCDATRPSEWAKKHNASYIAALRNGWQREIYEEFGWSLFFHDDDVLNTMVYVYAHDSYVYIGETCDPESRHVQHLNGVGNSVVFAHIPDYVEPVYFERQMEYSGEYAPYVMTGWQALRWEKRMIKRAVAMELKVLNKTHNPQWDGTRYSWEDE